MSSPTSINEIADTLRADNLRAESDVWNLKSLYSQLSPRWHWEIDKILRDKSYDIKDYWHIEPRIAGAYGTMKKLVNNFPEKTPDEIKRFFSESSSWYLPAIRDMFYDLAVYQKNEKLSESRRVFQELLAHIHSSRDIPEYCKNASMHDLNHMVCQFFLEIKPWVKKDQFLSSWIWLYWKWLPEELIFKLHWSTKHLQESECRAIFRQTYIDYCREHNIEELPISLG